jgi:hypothetical protein
LHDLSITGAALQLSDLGAEIIPEAFSMRLRCHVVWRGAFRVGGASRLDRFPIAKRFLLGFRARKSLNRTWLFQARFVSVVALLPVCDLHLGSRAGFAFGFLPRETK